MPRLTDLYEAHSGHRDKFEVLAFHDAQARDFEDLDDKLKKVKKQFWGNKDLPFPILLDSTGKTIESYGIRVFPTTLLIDPDGKLVGEADVDVLERKLPPLPAAVMVARSLNRNTSFVFDDPTLKRAAEMLTQVARVRVQLDEVGLKAAGVGPDTVVPLKCRGQMSLRSVLDLLVRAHDLGWSKGDKGLLIGAKSRGPAPELSGFHQETNGRIGALLAEAQEFAFADTTLEEVAASLEQLTSENFILDPRARKSGTLDPKTKVTGTAKDQPLTQSLAKLLDPHGLTVVVTDEVVLITTKELAKQRTGARNR